MRFEDMGLREELLRAIQEIGFTEPTPIQEQGIPKALEGRDLMCSAQTGTGKTAAFSLPILHRLASAGRNLAEGEQPHLRALILVPTRELAMQVTANLRDYGRHVDVVTATVFGGVPIEPQEVKLRAGVDILVATPGRLKDHIWRGNIDFRHTEYLVLDEADRMLDMGFIKDVREIVELVPVERQSMLFSATLDQQVQRFSKGILRDPLWIEVSPPSSTTDNVDQFLVRAARQRKGSTLTQLIKEHEMTRTIIFARTKSGASRLASTLRDRGFKATAIHSDRSQSERIQALENFREGRVHFLVATDIAARGLDIYDVSHVVNYDLPHSAEGYVHRIGRTARAGRRGMAISLVTPEDTRGVRAIEELIRRKLAWLGEEDAPAGAATEAGRSGGSRGRRRRSREKRSGSRAGSASNGNGAGTGENGGAAAAQAGGRSGRGRRSHGGRGPGGNGRRDEPPGRDRRPETGPRRGQAATGGRRRRSQPATPREPQRSRPGPPAGGPSPDGVAKKIIKSLKKGLFFGRS
jgi:ATP-dependent RNA helicase RhlE